ncbi:MAG TPA: hypothetical protein VG294_19700 [Solirubrobacteraceae bacterium]|jgi:hypothetical protein|nr:hypothetical protein [Solirubrobacteraceae bacterium]
MNSRLASDPETYWRDAGWGPEWRFPVTRADGEPLELALRVPLDWEAFDVMKRPLGEAAETGPLAQVLAPLARGIDAAGVIAIMGIAHPLPREGAPDAHLFVTLTVALADLTGAFPDSVPGSEVEPVEFAHPGGPERGVRIRRTRDAAVAPGAPPLPVLTVQYLVRTEHGVMAITFMTPQVDVFDRLGELFEKIAATCSLARLL